MADKNDYLLTVYSSVGSVNAICIGENSARALAAILSSACGVERITVFKYAGGILGDLVIEYGETGD